MLCSAMGSTNLWYRYQITDFHALSIHPLFPAFAAYCSMSCCVGTARYFVPCPLTWGNVPTRNNYCYVKIEYWHFNMCTMAIPLSAYWYANLKLITWLYACLWIDICLNVVWTFRSPERKRAIRYRTLKKGLRWNFLIYFQKWYQNAQILNKILKFEIEVSKQIFAVKELSKWSTAMKCYAL